MKVYVVESGEYEQQRIYCVAESVEVAVAWVKEHHSGVPAAAVEWEWDEGNLTLSGTFRRVEGHHTGGTFAWWITEYEVTTLDAGTALDPWTDPNTQPVVSATDLVAAAAARAVSTPKDATPETKP